MKNIIQLCIVLLTSSYISAQTVTVGSEEYRSLKAANQLEDVELNFDPQLFSAKGIDFEVPTSETRQASGCDCYVTPDGSYTLAMNENDDGSSALINIPFDFCFYGQTYNAFYINNNGNITFENTLAAFSATAFPSLDNKIIAPFWGDVDTRGGNGQVLYSITPTAVFINWEQVGYYSQQGDKLNTFQMILTDGVDPIIESGNVAFCYQDMQWTTGSASGGINGFLGTPATAGANKGDNIAFFLISRFDHAGVDFDGALGNPDGISWLDDKSFYFDVCNSDNIPPIPEGISQCDTIKVCSFGDTADVSISFLSPEFDQITSVTFDDGGLTSLVEIANNPGNTASVILRIIGSAANAGIYTITVTATDDFVPAGVTTITFVVEIDNSTVVPLPDLSPNISCDSLSIEVLNGPYDTYLWDDFTTGNTTMIDSSQIFGLTVSLNGCYVRAEEEFVIATAPYFNIPNISYCSGESSAYVELVDSLIMTNVTWGLPDPGLDSLYSNDLVAGTYTLTIFDSLGVCFADTTFTVEEVILPTLFQSDTVCSFDYAVTGVVSNNGGVWSSLSPEIIFSDNTLDNPIISTNDVSGTYLVTFTDDLCNEELSTTITFSLTPSFNIQGDFEYCDNSPGAFIEIVDSLTMDSVSWGLSDPILDALFSNVLPGGIYNINASDAIGYCVNDTTFTVVEMISPSIFSDTIACDFGMLVNGTSSVSGGVWTASSSDVQFSDDLADNPAIFTDEIDGVYVVTFTDYTCNESVSAEIDFPPVPVTTLTDTLLCNGVVHTVVAPINNSYPTIFEWDDGTIGQSIQVSEPGGEYTVVLSNVCYSTSATILVDYQRCEIVAPNVISLAEGSQNPLWYADTEGLREFNVSITNRWGATIYECSESLGNCYWDGRDQRGNIVDAGTYFYIIDAVTQGNKELQKHGFIQVIK